MIIDIVNNKLYIKDVKEKLKHRHSAQLACWGFKKQSDKDLSLDGDIDINPVIKKIIDYFNKHHLKFDLSKSAQELCDSIKVARDEFQNFKKRGQLLKNGEYDQADFAIHLDFLKTKIYRKLKDHQIKSSYHLWLVKNGANFSVPGSGKTTVVLSVYERLRIEGKVNVLFVVGPPACFGPWKYEFETTLNRKLDFKLLVGGQQEQRKSEYYKRDNISELYLTTYHSLLNDINEVNIFFGNSEIKAMMVIDEAHYIKQIEGNWANAVLNIAHHAKYKCVLTGTPIPKSYTDLYNLFNFLWLEENPVSLNDIAKLRNLEEKKDFENAKKILEPAIGPLFYRVRKADLKLANQVLNNPEIISMGYYERGIYDAITKKIRNYASDDYLKNIDLVEKLRKGRMIRLRQCLSYPKLLASAIEGYNEDYYNNNDDSDDLQSMIYHYEKKEIPGKVLHLLEMVRGFQDKKLKVVIWAHFIGTIQLIEEHLKKSGLRCKKIIGETPIERTSIDEEETREKIRDEFVDPNSGLDILIANPAACSESISLHKTCFHAVYYDLSYNCAQYLQSLDRIHRVGGSEEQEAHYYFLQYENTVEHQILDNLKLKAKKMVEIIEGDYNICSLNMFEMDDEKNVYEQLFLSK